MTTILPRALSGLAVTATSAALLVAAPPAQAAPAFSSSDVSTYSDANLGSGSAACTDNGSVEPPSANAALPENGGPVVVTRSTTGSYVANGDPTDTITNAATISATSSLTSVGGLPRAITMSYSGSVNVIAGPDGTSTCRVRSRAEAYANYRFTITQPMWVTLTTAHRGPSIAEAHITKDDEDEYHDSWALDFDGQSSATGLLTPGEYYGFVAAEVRKVTHTAYSQPASGSATITFAAPGSATAAPSGSAGKYVAMPGARNCTAHTATATLTTKKKLIKQIDKVTYTVNGTKAATLKGKKVKKGRTVALVLADNAPATIEATVLLDNGKKRTVTATYRACTS